MQSCGISGINSLDTIMGRQFSEHTVLELVRQMIRLNDLLEKLVEQQGQPEPLAPAEVQD